MWPGRKRKQSEKRGFDQSEANVVLQVKWGGGGTEEPVDMFEKDWEELIEPLFLCFIHHYKPNPCHLQVELYAFIVLTY